VYTVVCQYCGSVKDVKRRQTYCSVRCYGLAQRAHLTPHTRGFRQMMVCVWCCEDYVIYRRPSLRNPQLCCSPRCARRLQGWRRCKQHHGGTRRQIEKLHRMRCRGDITLRCLICGFDRLLEWSHIIPASKGGRYSEHNGLWLCPNHHRLFDRHCLLPDEVARLPAQAQTAYRLGRTTPVGPGQRRRAAT
jgi:HNH endonuclease